MARRGPNTERGKAASSLNAVKHGLRSNAPVIPEVESFEDWDRHRAAIVASWEPEGGFETFLAERVASLSWRLNRVPRYETETYRTSHRHNPGRLGGRGYLRREARHSARRDGQHG